MFTVLVGNRVKQRYTSKLFKPFPTYNKSEADDFENIQATIKQNIYKQELLQDAAIGC